MSTPLQTMALFFRLTCKSQTFTPPCTSAVTRYLPVLSTVRMMDPDLLWATNSATRLHWAVFENLTWPDIPHDTRSAPPRNNGPSKHHENPKITKRFPFIQSRKDTCRDNSYLLVTPCHKTTDCLLLLVNSLKISSFEFFQSVYLMPENEGVIPAAVTPFCRSRKKSLVIAWQSSGPSCPACGGSDESEGEEGCLRPEAADRLALSSTPPAQHNTTSLYNSDQ